MCCRNIHVSSIITRLDFVFILCLNRAILPQIQSAARQEDLFSADCIFLKDQVGPCMFEHNMKPERCVLSFCMDAHPLNNEIKAVRSGFNRLYRFIVLRKPFIWFGF